MAGDSSIESDKQSERTHDPKQLAPIQDAPTLPPTESDPRIDALVIRWEELREQGQSLTVGELCRDCPELVEDVQLRLRALDLMDQFLLAETKTSNGEDSFASGSPPVQTLPGYEILGELGRGGMGVVYKAKHLKLQRIVALKMILSGAYAGSDDLVRFLSEAEAVAAFQHPNIVQIFDVGRHDNLPYMALEFVDGGSLADRLKDKPLSAKQAAQLVEQIAHGMNAAHQAGIVHRDLKPDNVLLTEDGTPKVTDFGLAKRVESGEASAPRASGLTQTGAIMGTPSYMAPEQAGGEGKRVGPAADVYALGAIVYACLTGRPPFQATSVMDTLLQVVSNEPVPPRQWNKNVPADLETICLKCLEKDPLKRYASAHDLAEDLRSWQAGEPITARPVSQLERLVKWVKRRPVVAGLIAAVLLVTLVGIGGIAWAYGLAVERANQLQKANEITLKRLAQIQKGNDILGAIFKDLDIRKIEKERQNLKVVLGERLKKAAKQLKKESVGDPLVVAKLQNTLGESLLGLGHFRAALSLFQESGATRSQLLGVDHPDSLESKANLAAAYQTAGQLEKALPLFEETLKLRKAKLGVYHPDTLLSMGNFAGAYQVAGQLDKALPLQEKTLKLCKEKLGTDHPHTLLSMNNLAAAYQANGQPKKALPLFVLTLKLMKSKQGTDHYDTLTCMINLAATYQASGQLDKSLLLSAEALKLCKEKLGTDHPRTLENLNNLALGYQANGQPKKALPLLEEMLKSLKVKFGAHHSTTLSNMNNLAMAYKDVGQLEKALPLFEETFKLFKANLGVHHPSTLSSMNNVAAAYQANGQPKKALPLLEEMLKSLKMKLGAQHPTTLTTINNLAAVYGKAGQLKKALTLHKQTLKLLQATLGAAHPTTLTSMNNLAVTYRDAGQLEKALPLFKEMLKLCKAKLVAHHPITLQSMYDLGEAYRTAGQLEKALPLFVETLKLRREKLGSNHLDTLTSMNKLAMTYQDVGQLHKALPLYQETLKRREERLGIDHTLTLTSMNNLAGGYWAARQFDKALPLLQQALKLKKSRLGAEHPETLTSMNNLAATYRDAGQLHKALPLFLETLKLRKAKLGVDHPRTLTTMNNLAILYSKMKKLDQAISLHEKTLKARKKKLGENHRQTLQSMANLGVAYRNAGCLGEAIALLEKAHAHGRQHASFRWIGNSLLRAYVKAGKKVKAVALSDELLKADRQRLPAGSTKLAAKMAFLSGGLLKMQAYAKAEPFLEECIAIRVKKLPDDWRTFNVKSMLGGALLGQKKYKNAGTLLLEGYNGMKQREAKIPHVGKARLTEAEGRLAQFYEATRKKKETKLNGNLSDTNPEQVHKLKLTADMIVIVNMRSEHFDTYLRLEDTNGKKLTENNDIDYQSKILNSRILIMPKRQATYRIIATSFQRRGRGTYEIIIRKFNGQKKKATSN